MKKTLLLQVLLAVLSLLNYNQAAAQQDTRRQYFDGADTSVSKSIIVHLDTAAENIWQIGKPQKTIFDSAQSLPNVLVTDTINSYPMGNTSRFITGFNPDDWSRLYKIAFRWMQKLDMDTNRDGGIIEYSLDTGMTWINVFNNPSVYNFYGFDTTNKDTLVTGQYAFSGTDTVWRDIWLCFDWRLLNTTDSFMLRYTLMTDSNDNSREGWMIDNMMAQPTYFHTVSQVDEKGTFLVYPTITTGVIKIDTEDDAQEIEALQVVDVQGRVVRESKHLPVKTSIDISMLPAGTYFIKVGTAHKAEIHKIVLAP